MLKDRKVSKMLQDLFLRRNEPVVNPGSQVPELEKGEKSLQDDKEKPHEEIFQENIIKRPNVRRFKSYLFSISPRTWFAVWCICTGIFSLVAILSPDHLVVRCAEKLPYGTGLILSAVHAMAGNYIQSSRAFFMFLIWSVVFNLLLPVVLGMTIILCQKFPRKGDKAEGLTSRKRLRRTFAQCRIFLTCFLFISFCVESSERYKFNSSFEHLYRVDMQQRRNWMQSIENLTIFEASIPGSHDSGAVKGDFQGGIFFLKAFEPFSATNDLSIREQLNSGIRSLDLRLCGADKGDANICHGPILHYKSFLDALTQVNDFVTENPSEIVFVIVKPDTTQPIDDNIEKSVYGPVLSGFAEFRSKLISEAEGQQTIGQLVSQGKNIVFVNGDGEADTIFEDSMTEIWASNRLPHTYKLSLSLDREKFRSHLEDELCHETNNFNPDSSIYQFGGQMTMQTLMETVHLIAPMIAHMMYDNPNFGYYSLEEMAEYTNYLALHFLKNPNCTQPIHILTTDFVQDQVIEEIINRNYK